MTLVRLEVLDNGRFPTGEGQVATAKKPDFADKDALNAAASRLFNGLRSTSPVVNPTEKNSANGVTSPGSVDNQRSTENSARRATSLGIDPLLLVERDTIINGVATSSLFIEDRDHPRLSNKAAEKPEVVNPPAQIETISPLNQAAATDPIEETVQEARRPGRWARVKSMLGFGNKVDAEQPAAEIAPKPADKRPFLDALFSRKGALSAAAGLVLGTAIGAVFAPSMLTNPGAQSMAGAVGVTPVAEVAATPTRTPIAAVVPEINPTSTSSAFSRPPEAASTPVPPEPPKTETPHNAVENKAEERMEGIQFDLLPKQLKDTAELVYEINKLGVKWPLLVWKNVAPGLNFTAPGAGSFSKALGNTNDFTITTQSGPYKLSIHVEGAVVYPNTSIAYNIPSNTKTTVATTAGTNYNLPVGDETYSLVISVEASGGNNPDAKVMEFLKTLAPDAFTKPYPPKVLVDAYTGVPDVTDGEVSTEPKK